MSQGKCRLCQGIFSKNQMSKHLQTCVQQQPTGMPPQRTFRLLVEDQYQPEYWMYIEILAEAKFSRLDRFLRNIWVECCGHLSAFRYDRSYAGQIGKSRALGEILQPRMRFYYEYDFGSTTELTLKVISEESGAVKGKSVKLLARNEPPAINCVTCGKPASQVCAQCICENEGWLCNDCAVKHECGEEMLLPVVNSPRVGVCGYSGPATDP